MDFRIFVLLLASVSTMPATDIYLPSLPGMANYFTIEAEAIKDSIVIYQIGSLISALVLGFLSDHFGRKPLLIFGLSVFLGGSLLCTFAGSFSIFMLGRFLEGLGSISVPIVGWAMVQDIYTKEQAAKVMSLLGSTYAVLPLISPTLGGYFETHLTWQWNFATLSLLSALTLLVIIWKLEEPKIYERNQALNLNSYITNCVSVLKNTSFLAYVFIFALLLCGEWCYLTLIPFYIEEILSLNPQVCGLFISIVGASYICGSILTPQLINRFSIEKTIGISLKICAIGATLLALTTITKASLHIPSAFAIALFLFGLAINWAPTTSKSLENFKSQTGTASSIRSLIFTAASAFGSFLASYVSDSTLFPLSLLLMLCSLGSYFIFRMQYNVEKKKIF